MTRAKLPYVVFLDVDRTLIGNTRTCGHRFMIRRVIQELAEAGVIAPEAAATVRPIDPAAEMMHALRPGVADALHRIRSALPGTEFFLCTLGFHDIVHGCRAPGIEAATGVRFRRPMFCSGATYDPDNCRTLSSCGRKKLVGRCFARALESLREDYPALERGGADAARTVFEERFLMVDDTPAVAIDAPSNARLIVCPPYRHTGPWVDPFWGVPQELLAHKEVETFVRESVLPMVDVASPAACDANGYMDAVRSVSATARPACLDEAWTDSFWPRMADAVEDLAAQASPSQPDNGPRLDAAAIHNIRALQLR